MIETNLQIDLDLPSIRRLVCSLCHLRVEVLSQWLEFSRFRIKIKVLMEVIFVLIWHILYRLNYVSRKSRLVNINKHLN